MTVKQGAKILFETLDVMGKLPASVEVLDFHSDGIQLYYKTDVEAAAASLGVMSVACKPAKGTENFVKVFFPVGTVMVYAYEKKT